MNQQSVQGIFFQINYINKLFLKKNRYTFVKFIELI